MLDTTHLKQEISKQLELMAQDNYPSAKEVKDRWDQIKLSPYHVFLDQELSTIRESFFYNKTQMLGMLSNLIDSQQQFINLVNKAKEVKHGNQINR